MKIATVKDMHLKFGFEQSSSRKDDYANSMTNKLFQINEICKQNKVDLFITTGDLTDKKYPSAYSANKLKLNTDAIEIIDFPKMSIAGNHDLPYSNYDNVEDSIYGMISKWGIIDDVSFGCREFGEVKIHGIPYVKPDELWGHMDEIHSKMNQDDVNIVILHEHFIPFDAEEHDLAFTGFFQYTDLVKYDKVDYFILGHLHRGFPTEHFITKSGKKQQYINGWSLYRLARNYYSMSEEHKPEVIIIDTDTGEVKHHLLEINDFDSTFNIKKLEMQQEVDDFLEDMFTELSVTQHDSVEGDLGDLFEKGDISKEVKETINKYLDIVDKG